MVTKLYFSNHLKGKKNFARAYISRIYNNRFERAYQRDYKKFMYTNEIKIISRKNSYTFFNRLGNISIIPTMQQVRLR